MASNHMQSMVQNPILALTRSVLKATTGRMNSILYNAVTYYRPRSLAKQGDNALGTCTCEPRFCTKVSRNKYILEPVGVCG